MRYSMQHPQAVSPTPHVCIVYLLVSQRSLLPTVFNCHNCHSICLSRRNYDCILPAKCLGMSLNSVRRAVFSFSNLSLLIFICCSYQSIKLFRVCALSSNNFYPIPFKPFFWHSKTSTCSLSNACSFVSVFFPSFISSQVLLCSFESFKWQ